MADTTPNLGALLKQGFERLLKAEYGSCIAPPSYVTPIGIRPLDTLIGGGFGSSLPVMISAVPEAGKSTVAFQFAKSFLDAYPNSAVTYLDIEGASEVAEENSRQTTFGLDPDRFLYLPAVLDIKQVFDAIAKMADTKKLFEEKTGKELHVLVIWDSLASTPASKDAQVEDHNSVIGFRARELTHQLNHYKSLLVMSKITLMIVDQVRSDMQISGPFAPKVEKTVSSFGGGFKSASNIASLQHNVKQWLFMSKGKDLTPAIDMGIDGHELHIRVVKNKLAPSNVSVKVLFDKKYGIIPILSEYVFLRDMTQTEIKRTKKNEAKLEYPLAVSVTGRSKIIKVIDPTSGNILAQSEKFVEKNLIDLYGSDEVFKKIFDDAIDYSIDGRINQALFRNVIHISGESTIDDNENGEVQTPEDHEPTVAYDAETDTNYDPSTGEIIDEDMPPL